MYIAKKVSQQLTHQQKLFLERALQATDAVQSLSKRVRSTRVASLFDEVVGAIDQSKKREKAVHRLDSILEEIVSKNNFPSIFTDPIVVDFFPEISKKWIDRKFDKSLISSQLESMRIDAELASVSLRDDYLSRLYCKIDNLPSGNYELINKLGLLYVGELIFSGYSDYLVNYRLKKMLRDYSGGLLSECLRDKFDYDRKDFYISIKDDFGVLCQFFSQDNFSDVTCNNGRWSFLVKGIDPFSVCSDFYSEVIDFYSVRELDENQRKFISYDLPRVMRFNYGSASNFRPKFLLQPSLCQSRSEMSKKNTKFLCASGDVDILRGVTHSYSYYKQAMHSFSVENSIVMLWTSLESMMPYRRGGSDVENVQYFVAKFISIGAIARDLMGYKENLRQAAKVIGDFPDFSDVSVFPVSVNLDECDLSDFIDFLSNDFTKKPASDLYKKIKASSELLTGDYVKWDELLKDGKGNSKFLVVLNRINKSEVSVKFQIDRIYNHRNKIVHGGRDFEEAMEIWRCLEYYASKMFEMISWVRIKYGYLDIHDVFVKFESIVDRINSQLSSSKDVLVRDDIDLLKKLVQFDFFPA